MVSVHVWKPKQAELSLTVVEPGAAKGFQHNGTGAVRPSRVAGNFVLPKSSLLRRPGEYQRVYRKGKRLRGNRFSLIYCKNGLTENRLGISIHGIKKAVRRNRIKRIIREFYRLNKNFISPPSDIIFAIRKDFTPNSPQEVKQAVSILISPPAWHHHAIWSLSGYLEKTFPFLYTILSGCPLPTVSPILPFYANMFPICHWSHFAVWPKAWYVSSHPPNTTVPPLQSRRLWPCKGHLYTLLNLKISKTRPRVCAIILQHPFME